MADRAYGPVVLPLPDGPVGEPVVVTTATGVALPAVAAEAAPGSGGRRQASLTLPDSPRADGLWEAVVGGARLDFTVGPGGGGSYPLAALLLDLAERIGPVWRGVAVDGGDTALSDPVLAATSRDAVGLFVLRLPPDPLAGSWRRVVASDGELLVFDRPFADVMTAGVAYALVPVSPDNLLAAVRRAVASVGHTGRLPVLATELALDDARRVAVPRGWSAVSDVWVGDTRLRAGQWRLLPGGELEVTDPGPEGAVVLQGVRDARMPAFLDAPLDLDPVLVAAQASLELLLSRSGGPAVDPEDRLRRASLAAQEVEQARRTRRRRVPTNARPVSW